MGGFASSFRQPFLLQQQFKSISVFLLLLLLLLLLLSWQGRSKTEPLKLLLIMGNCCRKPAKCAHASSSNFSSGGKKADMEVKQDPTMPGQQTSCTSLNKSFKTSKVDSSVSSNLKSFSLGELKNATRNFRSDTFLGEGGFGCVFKGWIDANTLAPAKPGSGLVVAIKRLKVESFQGHREWLAEVNYLGQFRHEKLVKLIGYCAESDNRLLVYEHMPKGSLDHHLFRSIQALVNFQMYSKATVHATVNEIGREQGLEQYILL